MVHLSLLVGQLSGSETRCLVHHNGRHHLIIAGCRVAVQKERNECALQRGALAFIDGESRSCKFDAQFEIYDIVLGRQFPMRQRIVAQCGQSAFVELDHKIVGRGHSVRNYIGRKVGQRNDLGVKLRTHGFKLLVELFALRFELRDLGFGGLGLFLLSLCHEPAYILGGCVLPCEQSVQLRLNGFTAVVQLFDFRHGLRGINSLDGQTLYCTLAVVPYLFKCKHFFATV